jgi:uncharacterized protein YndB with AHSA1/START domain
VREQTVIEHSALHSTFTLERSYPVTSERVFAAWADPAAKARWFTGAASEHALDFRVHGRETVVRHGGADEPTLRFESVFHNIVPGERIVYASTLFADAQLTTVSLTTVQFDATGDGTRLVLTEQGTFLDGKESPDWREKGTSNWLDALAAELGRSSTDA